MKVCLLGAGVIALAAGPAMGAVFTDRATWEAALASRQDISFNGLSGYVLNTGPLGTGSDTVSFIPVNASWIEVRDSATPSCDIKCIMADTGPINGGLLGTLALVTNTAVGFNVFTVNNRGHNVTIRIYNVGSSTPDYTTTIPTVTGSTAVFFGYTGTVGIQQVEILTTPGTGDVALDNFSYGITGAEEPPPPTDTPEVPTLGYVGIGFLAVLLGSNRKLRLPGR